MTKFDLHLQEFKNLKSNHQIILIQKIVSSFDLKLDTFLNLFACCLKDMDEIDLMIPTHLKDILSDLFSVLGTLFVVCYATPMIIAVIIPLIFVFFFIQTSYLSTSRQLKR